MDNKDKDIINLTVTFNAEWETIDRDWEDRRDNYLVEYITENTKLANKTDCSDVWNDCFSVDVLPKDYTQEWIEFQQDNIETLRKLWVNNIIDTIDKNLEDFEHDRDIYEPHEQDHYYFVDLIKKTKESKIKYQEYLISRNP